MWLLRRLRQQNVCILYLIFVSAILLIVTLYKAERQSLSVKYFKEPVIFMKEMDSRHFLVSTPGCTINQMNVMDESIKDFIFKENVVICNDGIPALVESNLTSLFVIQASLTHYNVTDVKLLECCFQSFHRVDPIEGKRDDVVVYDEKCYAFKDSIKTEAYEFVKVICKYNESEIYKDFFHFVPLKNKTKELIGGPLSVLIIGVDAVSRLNFHRQMPKTVGLLEKLEAVEMLGYNKVGDNSFPNQIPVLTGMTEEELQKACWSKQNMYFDNCPFIWKKFKAAGFTTVFAEDTAWMGLFYYNTQGFKHQPTDYYWDHFNLIAEKEIGNKHRLNVNQCVGARSTYKVFVDYISRYVETMRMSKREFFGYFWGSTLSHDYLNTPRLGDQDYFDLISVFNRTGVLNNTALIFMSDHGIRWGEIRSTYQGWMEERLPFLYIGLPSWYRLQNSLLINNLKINTRRLTTPFDLHETLKDLIFSHNLTNDVLANRAADTRRRGYSLFQKITTDRTCEDAGISPHWCTCQMSKEVATNNTVVLEVANFIVNEHINKMLIGYADCAVLKLDEVLNARLQVNTADPKMKPVSQDFTITLRTTPGRALFEATVRKYITSKSYYFEITGTVSRINLYGKQSLCITDMHLKLYCYCKGFLSTL